MGLISTGRISLTEYRPLANGVSANIYRSLPEMVSHIIDNGGFCEHDGRTVTSYGSEAHLAALHDLKARLIEVIEKVEVDRASEVYR